MSAPVLGVGVVGLGQMGRGIARRLDAAGLLVAATDSDPGAFGAAGLSGAVAPLAVADMLARVDVALFAVPATADLRRAIGDAPGRAGLVVVDLTTSDPDAGRACAADLAARGIGYLDAAMTGGAAGADAGTLTLMAGGDEQVLARARPALDAISGQVFHLGPVGSGQAMKLIHNMILHGMFLANCEGLRAAEAAGLDAAAAVAVLNAGNARSFVSEVRFPRDILSGTMAARSTVSNLAKDLAAAVAFCDRMDRPTPYGTLTRDILARAVEGGMAGTDFSHLYPRYDSLVSGS